MDFVPFEKIARLSRNCVITEKIDGTNGVIHVGDDGEFLVGSRTRWITPESDNQGFATWAYRNKEALLTLGPGSHFGEWWGLGIQRNYNIKEKRFSLFNTARWSDDTVRPACCHVVPVLYEGMFDTKAVLGALAMLQTIGSQAAPGFMMPEGVVIWHEAARVYFKKTLKKDEAHKSEQQTTYTP